MTAEWQSGSSADRTRAALQHSHTAHHSCVPCLPSCPGPALQFPKNLEEQVCRTVHYSLQRAEELVSAIYDSLRPPVPAGDAAAAAAAEQAAGEQQPSPFGSKENEPQKHEGSSAAAAAAVKPPGEEAAAAGEADAAAGADAGAAAGAEPVTAKKAEGGAGAAAAAAAAATEQKSGKKAKTPKAPVSTQLLRTYILEVRQARAMPGWQPGWHCVGCASRVCSQGMLPSTCSGSPALLDAARRRAG